MVFIVCTLKLGFGQLGIDINSPSGLGEALGLLSISIQYYRYPGIDNAVRHNVIFRVGPRVALILPYPQERSVVQACLA